MSDIHTLRRIISQKDQDCQLAAQAGQALLKENQALKDQLFLLSNNANHSSTDTSPEQITATPPARQVEHTRVFRRKQRPINTLSASSPIVADIDAGLAADIHDHLLMQARALVSDLNTERDRSRQLSKELADSGQTITTLQSEIAKRNTKAEEHAEKNWNLQVAIGTANEATEQLALELDKLARENQKKMLVISKLEACQELWNQKEQEWNDKNHDLEIKLNGLRQRLSTLADAKRRISTGPLDFVARAPLENVNINVEVPAIVHYHKFSQTADEANEAEEKLENALGELDALQDLYNAICKEKCELQVLVDSQNEQLGLINDVSFFSQTSVPLHMRLEDDIGPANISMSGNFFQETATQTDVDYQIRNDSIYIPDNISEFGALSEIANGDSWLNEPDYSVGASESFDADRSRNLNKSHATLAEMILDPTTNIDTDRIECLTYTMLGSWVRDSNPVPKIQPARSKSTHALFLDQPLSAKIAMVRQTSFQVIYKINPLTCHKRCSVAGRTDTVSTQLPSWHRKFYFNCKRSPQAQASSAIVA